MVFDPETLELDFADRSLTENTRCAYPLEAISNASRHRPGRVPEKRGHADLRCLRRAAADRAADPGAGDVSLPVRLHLEGRRHRTRRDRTDQPTFSTCFGAPFMPRRPEVYGKLLQQRSPKTGATCWLVNTGWTGGAYGTGKRMPIRATRALLTAALDGSLNGAEFRRDPNFGFEVPVAVPGVDARPAEPARDLGRQGRL
jgi:phosphoenolpyruvate carboxykinase (ATP)